VEKNRPKLVKVRPKEASQQKFDPNSISSRSPSDAGNKKIVMLRQEVSIQNGRLLSPGSKVKSSFGDAVAFAAVSKKGMAHKRKLIGGTIQHLGNGKQMKVPSHIVQQKGSLAGQPRQFATKWKT
jgi:hypothetical protein